MTRNREAEPIYFESQSEFRRWLQKNQDKADSVWIGFYKKASGRTGISSAEALDEALCFGWIDGIRKSVDAISYKNRYTPRRPESNWSQVNIKRAEELIEAGLMRPSGLAAFDKRKAQEPGAYSYENRPQAFEEPYESRFRERGGAWEFFQSQPPGYRRTAIWWVLSAKQEATRLRRLDQLIADSESGRRLGLLSPGKNQPT